ncbi:MAG: AAA family ATPase, partial [Ignavibacteriaceae bacterium]|nr:AAA family ATPase [Ignavibacteriaceae bacterium]
GELFGEYYIGQPENTTELRNSYHILRFDFSGIRTDDSAVIFDNFSAEVKGSAELFLRENNLLDEEHLKDVMNSGDAVTIFRTMLYKIKAFHPELKIYLLIDEYDHFTNEIFSFSREKFAEMVSGNGWVRKFYEVAKQFIGLGVIDRFFATGVTPVTLDSMTSGFNVAQNISLFPEFNNLAGFTEKELSQLITDTSESVNTGNVAEYMNDIRLWYNGSRFSSVPADKLYNPQMVITFLSKLYREGKSPEEMTDVNVLSDYKKISAVLNLLPPDVADEIINTVTLNDSITERLTVQFNFELPYGKTEAVSLLYYNGLLSIDSVRFGIKTIYWEYFRYLFEKRNNLRFDTGKTDQAIFQLSSESSIDKLTGYVAEVMRGLSNRDLQNFSEKSLKMIFMTILTGTNAYYVQSEAETKSGYADLIIRRTGINPGRHDFLIELKYVKKGDQKNLEAIKESGLNQLSGYFSSMPEHERANYRAFLVIFTDKSGFEITQL